jgi:hypothetical protein
MAQFSRDISSLTLSDGESEQFVVQTFRDDALKVELDGDNTPYDLDIQTAENHPEPGNFNASDYERSLPLGVETFTDTNTHTTAVDSVNVSTFVEITNNSGGDATFNGSIETHSQSAPSTAQEFATRGTGGRASAYRDGKALSRDDALEAGKNSVDGANITAYFGGFGTYKQYRITDYSDIGEAINDAISDGQFSANNPGRIVLPQGEFVFSTTIEPTNAVRIEGNEGKSLGPWLKYDGSGVAIDATINSAVCSFSQFFLEPVTGGLGTGIKTNQTCDFDNLYLRSFDLGIDITGSQGSRDANYTSMYNVNSSFGITGCSVNANIVHFLDCRFSGNNDVGLFLDGGTNINITGCSFENDDVGIETGSEDVNLLSVRDSYFENNDTSSAEIGVNAGTADALTLRGNRFGALTDPNVLLDDVQEAQVYWNKYQDSGEIKITSNATEVDFGYQPSAYTLTDNGTRTLRNRVGQNAGDPSSTGEWNGNGKEGITVVDTNNNNVYVYMAGSWVQM